MGSIWVMPKSCIKLGELSFGAGENNTRSVLWKVAMMAIWWRIWLERNRRIFERREEDSIITWDRIKLNIALWIHSNKEFCDLLYSDLVRDWPSF
ncbi:hypothetical protein L484_009192 [Morus notabilis]|uniref:Reverse transcriptase zinc-binding domain-containing protein n=1 Tax=Morus notabilis TaxID=981085 RepID=W9S604_9ROSA|nr:hypothetical protein L484_009192 [Morus notabilis]